MINLLPPRRLLDIRIARRNTSLRRYVELSVVSTVVLVLAVVASFYFLNTQRVNTQKTVDINEQKVKQLEPVQAEARQLSTTVNTISRLLSRNIKFSQMLTNIGGLMPSGSSLTGLQLSIEDLNAPLVVSANIDSEAKAAVLRNNLLSSSLFKSADIVSIIEIKEDQAGQSTNSAEPSAQPVKPVNPYKYTVTINASLKDDSGVKKL